MSAFPSLIAQEVVSVIRFPLWWYGAGFRAVLVWMEEDLRREWGRLGIRLWTRSWLQPMYGVSDFVGRMISVVMRTFVIIARLLWWLVRASIYGVGALAWLVWLPGAVILLFLPFVW